MKIRTRLIVAAFTLASIMAVSAFAYSFAAGAQNTNNNSRATRATRSNKKVNLKCENYGGHQDVSKNPEITNNTSKEIPLGTKLYWTSTDGDHGTLVLEAMLAPKGTVKVYGHPGQSYTCKAWYIKQG